MDETIIPTQIRHCPNCSKPMERLTTCQRTGVALGAVIGGIFGYVSADDGDGALGSALAGFFAGATVGLGIGKVFDEQVLDRHHCYRCDVTIQ